MTEFQVGDKVRTHTATVVGFRNANPYRVIVAYDDQTEATYHADYIELVERPRKKLRVGSVWQVGESGIRYTYLGEDLFGATTRQKVHERSSLTVDEEPDIWREVPVEELEREAQA